MVVPTSTSARARLRDDVRHPERPADLDQLPARHDQLAPARQRRRRQQHRAGAVVHDHRRLGAGQLAQQLLDVRLPRPALAGARGRTRGSSSPRPRQRPPRAQHAASGARPRFVWTITPLALITRRRRGRAAARAIRAPAQRDRSAVERRHRRRRAPPASDPRPRCVDHRARRAHGVTHATRRRARPPAPRPTAAPADARPPQGTVPSTQPPAPPSISFFQIGASALIRSIASRAPANASPRCGADAATITHGCDNGTSADPVLGRDRGQPVLAPSPPRGSSRSSPRPSRRTPRTRAPRPRASRLRRPPRRPRAGLRTSPASASIDSGSSVTRTCTQHRLATAHRRHQRQLVASATSTTSSSAYSRFTAITTGTPAATSASDVDRIAHARALRQLQRHLRRAGPLAQHREELHRHLHDL